MSAKSKETSPRTLANINKQIIEIKKKIQLSEGQRKAAFEEYERERKICEDQILKLKKDIKELTVKLKENKDETAAYRIRNTKLETIVGPLSNKTVDQVKEILDLKTIDLRKQLDLLKHRKQQRKSVLENLAKEYQTLLSKKPKEEVVANISKLFKKENSTDKKKKKKKKKDKSQKKVDVEKELTPYYKKKFYALQNNIHRVDVQWREAEHIRNSYKAIESSLLKNKSYFESSLKDLEEKQQNQQKDINELQRMNAEAANTRLAARLALEKEERTIVVAGRIREKQNAEQQALCAARKAELEKLERQIYQSVKLIGGPQAGVTAGTGGLERNDAEEDTDRTGDEDTSSDEDNETSIKEAFEKLKEATGVTNADEVFTKFKTQKETRNRLEYLKDTTEAEKKQLELTQHNLSLELEKFRYAQERDKEKYGDDILSLKEKITEQENLIETYEEKCGEKQVLLQSLCNSIFNLYISFKDVGIQPLKEVTSDAEKSELLLKTIFKDIENIVKRSEVIEEYEDVEESKEEVDETEHVSLNEEELLPNTYNILFRRSPVPMQGMQLSAPPAIDDEEEVPSRSLLKRQAQLVADAKSRRKALRIPMNRK